MFSCAMQSQCFDCAKNLGGWVDDFVADLKKTNDGVYLIKNTRNFQINAGIYKYDFNCNLLWKKEIDNFEAFASRLTSDNQGNIYVLLTWAGNNYAPPFPKYYSGIPMYEGINLYKFDKNGNLIWNKPISSDAQYGMKNIFIYKDILYIIGTFYNKVTISNQITLTNPIYNESSVASLLFISKFNLNGDLLEAEKFGPGDDEYTSSEIDENGNMYFSRRATMDASFLHSNIDKINSSLKVVWSKEISNNKITKESVFTPTFLHYNPVNEKLYLWSIYYKKANLLGNIFTDPSNKPYVNQSILSEFNILDGNLERIKQINNTLSRNNPAVGIGANPYGNTGYITEKDNQLYVFSSFSGTMGLDSGNVISARSASDDKEELILFKINLDTFNSEFVLKSNGASQYPGVQTADSAGPILFNGNDLYLTSNFESYSLTINNSVINNNSGNNDTDVMLYKYKLDSSPTGEIIAEKTCFNTPTKFNINGNFDSILWDFDDPNSTINNTASINNPEHQFTVIGTYNVSATIYCGTETQTIKKEINITNTPNNFSLDPIYACETISGSGISNSFDTSNINASIIGNQTNLIVEYRDSNGVLLSTPLPNPYTNKVKNLEIIKVKSYNVNNTLCYVENDLKLYTTAKPINPTIANPQTFCIQQNATLDNIQITGQNTKWYDALTAGAILPNTSVLQNNVTYYASQTINGCESERTPVTINIQNTLPPSGTANQPFCSGQNPTIADIQVNGNLIKWYDSDLNGTLLPTTTSLQDGKTYYASQTVNSCESPRFGVTVSVGNTPDAPLEINSRAYCKNEKATLSNIQVSGQNLKWYSSNIAAGSLPSNTLLENNVTYYVSQTTGCESERTPVLVKVSDTPLPTGKKEQSFCIDENATLDNIQITGTSIKWYDALTGGNVLASTNLLKNGSYYATQTLNSCESERLMFTITIHDTKSPLADDPQTFCVQENATIKNIKISGDNVKWYNDLNAGTELPEATPLENGITYYASETANECESKRTPVTIKILAATTAECINFVDELPYPKFFTPNNDTYNDTWTIDFAYLAPNTGIRIFDRYGKFIKELAPNTSWNGTYIGQNAPASDYWFIVTRLNGTEFRGHFSLKR